MNVSTATVITAQSAVTTKILPKKTRCKEFCAFCRASGSAAIISRGLVRHTRPCA